MASTIAAFIGFAPLVLIAVGLVPGRYANAHPSLMIRIAMAAGTGAFAIAAGSAILLMGMGGGPVIAGAGLPDALPISLYYDALSAVMGLLVAFVGLIVIAYSRNYLDGDADQGRFMKWLCLTLASVLTLILSGNMALFILAWVATSLSLHQLLVFYKTRPAARLAAAKKFIASRLGDACLLGAAGLMFSVFGGLEFETMFAAARDMKSAGDTMSEIHWIAALLAIAALLKSAQFPFHGWLTEVMETPTPVSALLHAGIINAGGFLILRFGELMALSVGALELLAIVGGFTALFGSVVMLTQTSVKVSLAWSTIAQMGFMMLQCGLGAFSAAALHIVAHSLYKAHAFLSSGSVIDLARAAWVPDRAGKPHPIRQSLILAGALGLAWVTATVFGVALTEAPGVFALGAVLVMGVTHIVTGATDGQPSQFVIVRGLSLAGLVGVVYFALQAGSAHVLADALPAIQPLRGLLDLSIVIAVVLSFGAVAVLQKTMPYHTRSPRWQALYVHLFNGLYINAATNRLVQRLWPAAANANTGKPQA